MSDSGRHLSSSAAIGNTETPRALPLQMTLPQARARDNGPIQFASWRIARDHTLAAMLAGQGRLLVTGPPGVGKTLLLHNIAHVLHSAGWDAAVELRTLSVFDDAASTGKPRAILIDEADRLSDTELRLIRDTARHTVLLAGLNSLDGRCPGWTRVTLAPLTPDQCIAFVGLWLAQAGYPTTLLSEDAALRAADLSRGVPRLLASLLNGAVWLAVSEGANLVSRANVEESAGFRDRLDLSSNLDKMAAPGYTAAVPGHSPRPSDVDAPRRALAESVAQTRINPAPAAVLPSQPAWTGSARSAVLGAQDDRAQDDRAQDDRAQDDRAHDSGAHDSGAHDSGAQDGGAQDDRAQDGGAQDDRAQDDRARDHLTLMPIPTRARSGALQNRPRVLAFAMVGMVCMVGVVCIVVVAAGPGWLSFRPTASATVSAAASRSGPEPFSPVSLPAVADAELAAFTPVASDRVPLAALALTRELRSLDAASQTAGTSEDAEQRVAPPAPSVEALPLGGAGQNLAVLQVAASIGPMPEVAAPGPITPGPTAPDAADLSAPPAQAAELVTVPSVAARNAAGTGASASSTTDGPVPVMLSSEAEPAQGPVAMAEPPLPPATAATDPMPVPMEPASAPETASTASSPASGDVQHPVVPLDPARQASAPTQADTASATPGTAAASEAEPLSPPVNAVQVAVVAPALASSPAPPSAASLSPATLALLVQRGHQLLAVGDVSGARLLYGRAATAGSGMGALWMGRTFDPAFLQQIGARVAPSNAAAEDWYRRAAALGSKSAAVLLQQPSGPALKQIGPK